MIVNQNSVTKNIDLPERKIVERSANFGGFEIPEERTAVTSVNNIDRTIWEQLKKNKIRYEISSSDVYAYGSKNPHTITGNFTINVCVNNRCVSANC